ATPDRSALAAALATANRSYGHPKAEELAARLADPETRVVVTGQQAGLFAGPLYTLSKALAAARWAAKLEADGQKAVAVFWVATEDHDWDEASTATVLTHQGPLTVDLGDDPEPLTPTGMRSLGPGVADALAELREAMPGERYEGWLERVAGWYRPDARFGEAFCRLMVGLLGERCPLLLDSMLPAVKTAQRPWLARLVERRHEVEAAYAAADAEIEGRGHPLQVHPQRGVSPLFLLRDGERRRIAWAAGEDGEEMARFELRGSERGPRPVEELLETVAENPLAVSPGVLARPAIQDAVLGTSLFVLGPGELSYLPQVAPLYRVLEIPPPAVTLRPQMLVLEAHQIDKLDEVGLTLAELMSDDDALEGILAARSGGELTGEAKARIAAILDELEAPALDLDPNLERPLGKTRDNVLGALDAFAGKVRSSAARRDEVTAGRVAKLRGNVLPEGKPQERLVSSLHYHGKYGDEFADAAWEQLGLDGRVLQVVTP
ncbi:MAG TPA: bacillithiol biosynthesis cysteine-adding enzyme BshC, partial [Thermoanaerobaculia bacterium]|nr:bacillithiol biosynthesis cysteine-adding enzyme BshC [Thermoanaerobaculia bacterium]